MKRLLLLSILLLSLLPSFSQWTSPGNGSTYCLRDLTHVTDGCVTQSWQSGYYYINGDMTISPNDRLVIDRDDCPVFAGTHLPCVVVCKGNLTIQGSLRCMEALNADASFRTEGEVYHICFDHCTDSCFIGNTDFIEFSGIRLVESPVSFVDCYFGYFTTSYASGAVEYMNCDPVFIGCEFTENQGSAICSGANVTGSPQILGCWISWNVLSNENQPQINLGPGSDDTIRIVDNTLYGYDPIPLKDADGHSDLSSMVGGIAVSDLLQTGSTKVLLKNNTIAENRYGYTQQGYAIDAVIEGNEFLDNNFGNDPMTGGSGIAIYGYSADCKAKLRNNLITGNLWGVTAINYYNIDMGTDNDYGYNILYENHNDAYGSDQDYALYVNGHNDISAVGNYWGGPDEEFAENVICHRPDLGESYGLASYTPVLPQNPYSLPEITIPNSTSRFPHFTLFPNPANGVVFVRAHDMANREYRISNVFGQILKTGCLTDEIQQIDVQDLPNGIYFVTIGNSTQKLLIS